MANLAVKPAPGAETTEDTLDTETQQAETSQAETSQAADETQEATAEQKEESRQAFAARKAKEQLAAITQELAAYKRRDEEARIAAEEARKSTLTEEARIKEERDQLAAENYAFKMDSLRERIGREFNLRDEMIPRLIGTDEEALRADATDLVAKGFTKAKPRVGSPTNPATEQGPTGAKYTRAQIADRAFFLANENDIMAAMREGRISQ